jgi:hypothetical protein
MQKIYLILRNNKQNGPFSLEELVALSLKPHDLIWVEGKSAGWRYPTEIEALKTYVQQPAKSGNAAASVPSTSPSSTPRDQQSRGANPAPRTGHIYISIPTKSERVAVRTESAAPVIPGEEGAMTEEALERKAQELYQKVQAYAEKKEQATPGGVETKYARSLDDLKQEYSDWLNKSKKKRKRTSVVINKKLVGFSGMVAAVFLAGFIFAKWVTGDDIKVQPLSMGALPVQKDKASNEVKEMGTQAQTPLVTVPYETLQEGNEPATDQNIVQGNTREKTTGQKNTATKSVNQQQKAGTTEMSSLIEKYTGQAVPATAVTEQPVEAPKKKIPLAQQVSMNGRYMKDDERKNITGLEITVMNNSDQVVRSVEVQVSYHKKGGRQFDTETVFINNISPHTPLTIARPGNKKAHSATFQVTQVNGD